MKLKVVKPDESVVPESFGHVSVMSREVVEALMLRPGMLVVDCTLGLGGHSLIMGGLIGPKGRLVGIDQDDQAIAAAKARLSEFPGRLDIVKSNFRRLAEVLDGLEIKAVDAILFDLGVSSIQLDDASRGFSFRRDGPLDMRMDSGAPVSAFEIVNTFAEEELARVLWQYGEERFSRRIARNIVKARAASAIDTTAELANIILRSLPYKHSRDGAHPATRSFQGIRIAVNQELAALEAVLATAFSRLKVHGRMCVISFHSLEDRIVKDQFRALALSGQAMVLTKKPLRPAPEEEQANPRSRSARLRALERIL
ncbi:MAG: 16S rRNA (cytosine(1402)-N(4))-methyltransferase RsmH [Candidatus Omnitrophica bacterium]|nr:16S rRNA (cytosine(1402)-N(4))-methyltransferase RsmH [Candidatus Omnitrophota bacterium]